MEGSLDEILPRKNQLIRPAAANVDQALVVFAAASPEPNLNLVEIPGRRQGPIDLSKYPTGKLTYQRISGSWNFLFEPRGAADRIAKYEAIRRWLHGRTTTVKMEEDPQHYYRGFFSVSSISTGNGPSQIAVGFNLEPLRYNVSDDSEDTGWVSDWPT